MSLARDPRRMTEMDLHMYVAQAVPAWRETYHRMLLRVLIVGECWEFQGYRNKAGYGKIRVSKSRKMEYAHRIALFANDVNLDGLETCHRCDNKPCCNPAHLFAGTRQDNVDDAIAKGRWVAPPRHDQPKIVQAGIHHWQKLTKDQVVAIKERCKAGETLAAIAADYGVSFQQIGKIRSGQRWAHL